MIHIALCFSDADGSYHTHAAVTMVSVLANTERKVCFHILSSGTTEEHNQRLCDVAEKYNATITFYDGGALDLSPVQPFLKKLSPGTFYRLYLHNLITHDKILYLDCDIICNLDIGILYDIDISGKMCAASTDTGLSKHLAKIHLPEEHYFNAGMLLLNLAWMRENAEALSGVIKSLAATPHLATYGDQDILNRLANEKNYAEVVTLDPKYNFFTATDNREWLPDAAFQDKLVHCTGLKPWRQWSNSATQYWKYYSMAPWGGDVFEKMSHLETDPAMLLMRRMPFKEERALRRFLDFQRLGVLGYFAKRLGRVSK